MVRIVIREGIVLRDPVTEDTRKLMDLDPEKVEEIKDRISEAVKQILKDTEYDVKPKNPASFGVEVD